MSVISFGRSQVRMSQAGPWHRLRDNGGALPRTACGLPIDGAYLSRDASLDGLLCPRCFTEHERDTGEMKRIEAAALEEVKASELVGEWFGDESTTDEIEPVPPGQEKDGKP